MSPNTISCSIIIPTHSRRALLSQTLRSLEEMIVPSDTNLEIVVVANNCTDDTVEYLQQAIESYKHPLRVVVESELGLNPARNRGVQEACCEWLAFLDDDVWVHPGWLSALVDIVRERKPGLVGGHVELWWQSVERPAWLQPDMEWMLSNNEYGEEVRPLGLVGGLIGANFVCHKSVFEKVGLFRKGLDRVGDKLLGAGESELVQRAVKADFRGFYVPGMSVKHWVAPQRARPDYVRRVSYGYGFSRVMLKNDKKVHKLLRCFVGHLYLSFAYGLIGSLAALLKLKNSVRYQCRAYAGFGGLYASWRLLVAPRFDCF